MAQILYILMFYPKRKSRQRDLTASAPTIHRNLTQDSEIWPIGMQLFHLMGHYITAVCTVDIINGVLESNNNNILRCVLLSEAGVLENDSTYKHCGLLIKINDVENG